MKAPGTAIVPTGARRLLANAGGESLGAIAKREGVAKQSVAESVVRASFSIGETLSRVRIGEENEPMRPASDLLIENLIRIATDAKKAVIYGGNYALVPDYALRASVSLRLLDYMESAAAPKVPAALNSEVIAREEVLETESRKRTRREVRAVRADVMPPDDSRGGL